MVEISVILPVYNVESYIKKSMDSILGQTFADFELLVVDDASEDCSISVVEELGKKDDRVKIFRHESNRGLGPARNTGLEKACGKYVCFVDSDDWIDSGALQASWEAAERTGADIVEFGRIRIKNNGDIVSKTDFEYAEYTQPDEVVRMLGRSLTVNAPQKLYRREFLTDSGVTFLPMFYEDVIFSYSLFWKVRKLVTIPDVYYYWRYNENSISLSQLKEQNIRDMISVVEWLGNNIKIYGYPVLEQWVNWMTTKIWRSFLNDSTKEYQERITGYIKYYLRDNVYLQMLLFERLKELRVKGMGYMEFCWVSELLISGRMLEKDKIVIYGSGSIGRKIFHILKMKQMETLAFVDSDVQKHGSRYCGMEILSPVQLLKIPFDKIIVGVWEYEDIKAKLDSMGYKQNEHYLIFNI